jgi:hypothetical protein
MPLVISLTADEVRALTLFKWRYSIQDQGFTRREAERLLFWKWRSRCRPSMQDRSIQG